MKSNTNWNGKTLVVVPTADPLVTPRGTSGRVDPPILRVPVVIREVTIMAYPGRGAIQQDTLTARGHTLTAPQLRSPSQLHGHAIDPSPEGGVGVSDALERATIDNIARPDPASGSRTGSGRLVDGQEFGYDDERRKYDAHYPHGPDGQLL